MYKGSDVEKRVKIRPVSLTVDLFEVDAAVDNAVGAARGLKPGQADPDLVV